MSPATLRHFKYVATENPVTLAAFVLFTLFVVLALFGVFLAPYDPLASSTQEALQAPSGRHWFGTDSLGRDILSRIMVAARLDFGIAVSAVAASFTIGAALGAFAGFYGGWTDRVVGRLADTIMAFPLFVLAMGIVAALGNTIRVARAEVNVRRNAGYVEAARLSGNSSLQTLALHIFPNILPPMMVQVSLNMGWAILNAAGLSFIGLGVRPPQAEWGIMVAEGATYIISGEWWVALFPGAVLMLAVFTFNLLGDGLRDLLDPRMRT